MSLSGDTLLIGAARADIGANLDQGAAYVFVRSGGVWTEQAKLVANDGAGSDSFGGSVALSGETVLVGATGASVGGQEKQGAAYVFVRSGSVWTQEAKLVASDGSAVDSFGTVALSGDTALVGASADSVAGGSSYQGSAYVFERNGGAWTEQAHLFASDGKESDAFGGALLLSGDTAIFGVREHDLAGKGEGAVYVFGRSGATWTQDAKLVASDGAPFDAFGGAVSLSGDTLLIGATGRDINGMQNLGAAYLFARDGVTWTEKAKLVASDGAQLDNFGVAVALSGDTALVTAFSDDVGMNNNQGSAYAFVLRKSVCCADAVCSGAGGNGGAGGSGGNGGAGGNATDCGTRRTRASKSPCPTDLPTQL